MGVYCQGASKSAKELKTMWHVYVGHFVMVRDTRTLTFDGISCHDHDALIKQEL